ncbi:hypothetical protein Gogos_017485, partial [Gossypium gossypioides]|nr:hypothetical protein [Gossypium gossypioides]
IGKTISCPVLLSLISSFYLLFAIVLDTITPSKSIKDPEFIISHNGIFRLGFFSLANSSNHDGNLIVLNGKTEILWSSNVTNIAPNATTAQLSNLGNLVLSNGDDAGSILWESFQHPCNVFLQTM